MLLDDRAELLRVIDRRGIRLEDRRRGAESGLGCREGLRIASGDDNPRAFGLQELGGCETDAGRSARDQYGFVFHWK